MRQTYLDDLKQRLTSAVDDPRKRHNFKSKDTKLKDVSNQYGVPYDVVRKAYDDPYYVPDLESNIMPEHHQGLMAIEDLVLPNRQRKIAPKRDVGKFKTQLQNDIASGKSIGMDYIDRFVNENAKPEERAGMKDQLATNTEGRRR